MGPSIIETVVRSNGKAPSPQVLHSPDNRQPYSASSSIPGTAQFVAYKNKSPVSTAARDTNKCGTSVQSPQHGSQALPSGDALRVYDDFDSTTSPPQANSISQDIKIRISGASLDDGKVPHSSRSVESILPVLAGASLSMERPPEAADIQPNEDEPIYSIGETKLFDKFQKCVPPLYEARWEIIFPDIFDQVQSRLRRGRFAVRLNRPRALPNIQLMSAGLTKELSLPAVVVVIPKHIRAMQEFLDANTTVQNRCKPRDGTTVEMLVFACKGQSTLVGMAGEPLERSIASSSESNSEYLSDDDVSMDSSDDSDSSALLYPMAHIPELNAQSVSVVCEQHNIHRNEEYALDIRLITKDGSRSVRGTCGSIFQLKIPNSSPRQVGLMAGHLLEQLSQGSAEANQGTLKSNFIIGDMLYPKNSEELPRHDWALFDATRLSSYYSTTNQHSFTIAQDSDLPEMSTTVFIRTSRGEMAGTLSSSTSGIMLNPNQGFVRVRMIIMDKGSTITKGDSGALAVHKGLRKIFGHIIATNNNGHAYMVPLHASIAEMKTTLGVVDVSLAISTEPHSQHRSAAVHEQRGRRKRSAQVFLRDHQSIHPAILDEVERLKDVAKAYLSDGKAAEAIPLLEKAVSSQIRLPQEDRSRTASLHGLGWAYLETGQFLKAIEILKTVLKISEECFSDNRSDCLEAQHGLAVAYTQNGQASEAIQLLDHVVSVRRVTCAKSDRQLLASQIVLAQAELMTGRASDAVKLLEHVVAIADMAFSEKDEIRIKSRGWLNFASRQLYDWSFARPVDGPKTAFEVPGEMKKYPGEDILGCKTEEKYDGMEHQGRAIEF